MATRISNCRLAYCKTSTPILHQPIRSSILSQGFSKATQTPKPLSNPAAVSRAKYGTATPGSMPPEKRAQSRRMEQLDMDARALERNFTRDWKPGDVYAPHDLSAAEARKWKKRQMPTTDAFDALSMNPLDHYKNFSIMSEYMTEMGRIKHSRDTGLRAVNQRKVAKAIRRAIGLGLMPSVHRHPELLKRAILKSNMTGRYS